MRVLVTGATGYIGGRLAPHLLDAGHDVVCVVRSARKLTARPWFGHRRVLIIEADAANPSEMVEAMRGCSAAYYLIHSMLAAGPAYRDHDRRLAEGFSYAAAEAGVERIMYLGGLGETGVGLSEHLASRREVEMALARAGVPVTVFRAAMIIGSGSASFEKLRYLVERLPVMVTPRWVSTECQPIAIQNVLHYLVACLHEPATVGKTLDIGGADTATYVELMQWMAEALGLRRRLIIPVPVLTPRLSSLWIHLVTPIHHRIARPLAEGLRNRVVCRDKQAHHLMPQPLLSAREAINAAVGNQSSHAQESWWSDAGVMPGDPAWAGGKTFVDRRRIKIEAPPSRVFAALGRLGGEQGYYAAHWLWAIRGWMDRLLGGPGLSRGRRPSGRLATGDAVDFWRVTNVIENEHLELHAEMKLPGVAKLTFDLERPDDDPETTLLTQAASFKPRGALGLFYWAAVTPFHFVVFNGMLVGIRRETLNSTGSTMASASAIP